MIERLKEFDADFVLFVNGKHTPFLDSFFYTLSKMWVWIPLYVFLLFVVVKYFKKRTWLVLGCIAFLILISDQFASGFLKNWVMRYRPSHNEEIGLKLHLVNGYAGGLYGFISSHAANVFALTSFLTFILKDVRLKWMLILWCWATLVAFSRIYLGVHYLSDVLGGVISGVFFGWIVSKMFFIISAKSANRSNQKKYL